MFYFQVERLTEGDNIKPYPKAIGEHIVDCIHLLRTGTNDDLSQR